MAPAASIARRPAYKDRCADNPPPVGEPGSCVGESISDSGQLPTGLAPAEPIPVKLIAFIYTTIFLVEIIFYIVPIQLPFYLEELTGASAAQSGLAIAAMSLSFAITSMFYDRIAAR
jgi:hypothetical protein